MPHSHQSPSEGLCRAALLTPTELPRCFAGSGDHAIADSSSLAACFWTVSAFAGFCYFSIPLANALPSLLSLGWVVRLFALRLVGVKRVSTFILGISPDFSIVFFLPQLTPLQVSARLAEGKDPSDDRGLGVASFFGSAWSRWVRNHSELSSCLSTFCPSLLP